MAQQATSTAQVVVSAVDRVTGPVRRINDRIQSITEPVRRVNRSISQLGDVSGINRLTHRFRNLGAAVGRVGDGIGRTMDRLAGVGAGVGAAAFGVGTLTYQTAQASEQVGQLAQRLGVGVEALQEMTYAGQQFGVERRAMTDGLKELTMRADEFAQTGSGPGADAFKRLGLDRERLRQVKGDTEALFNLVQRRIGAVQDTAARQRIADEIFGGQGGEQLVDMLGASREELRRLRQEARDVGYVATPEQVERAETFMDRVRRMTGAIQGMGRAVGQELMPHLSPLVQRVTEFATANRELIATRVGRWVGQVADWLERLFDPTSRVRERIRGLMGTVEAIGQRFSWLSEVAGGPVRATLATIAGITFAPLVASITAAIPAVLNLGAALMTTPVGWITAGIAAIAYAGYKIYENWGPISDWFSEQWTAISETVGNAVDRVTSYLEALPYRAWRMVENAGQWLARLPGRVWDALTAAAERVVNWVWPDLPTFEVPTVGWSDVQSAWNDFTSWVESVIPSFGWPELPALQLPEMNLVERGRQLVESIRTGIAQAWGDLAAWFRSKINGLLPSWLTSNTDVGPSGGGNVALRHRPQASETAQSAARAAQSAIRFRMPRMEVPAPPTPKMNIPEPRAAASPSSNSPRSGNAGAVQTPVMAPAGGRGRGGGTRVEQNVNVTVNGGSKDDAENVAATVRQELMRMERERQRNARGDLY